MRLHAEQEARADAAMRRVHLGGPVVHDAEGSCPLVLGLHGYGSEPEQLRTLVPMPPGVSYYALAGARPLPDGYGRGYYDVEVAADGTRRADSRDVERIIDEVEQQVHRLVAASGPIVLLGYSQGASVVVDTLLTRDVPLAAAVVLAGTSQLRAQPTPAAPPVPVFMAAGAHDPFISRDDVSSVERALQRRGHCVRLRIDPVPHVVARAAVRSLHDWLTWVGHR